LTFDADLALSKQTKLLEMKLIILLLTLQSALGMRAAPLDTASRKITFKTETTAKMQSLNIIIKKLNLIMISGEDLGLKDTSLRYETLCTAAKKRGFYPCPPEKALALRKMYTDQPLDEQLYIALEPSISLDTDGNRIPTKILMFTNERDSHYSMNAITLSPNSTIPLNLKFVFLAPWR
jgi:hypothetical protein